MTTRSTTILLRNGNAVIGGKSIAIGKNRSLGPQSSHQKKSPIKRESFPRNLTTLRAAPKLRTCA
ncbi:MAG TPA: hypothetical protein DDZ51_04080 [Planctomycetaceae bacterium]|nr:hypothetical protein [Planctomycetaceae bacterium]